MHILKNDPESVLKRENFLIIFGGILSAITLISSLYSVITSLYAVDLNEAPYLRITTVVAFASLAISRSIVFLRRNSKISLIKNIAIGALYTAMAIALIFINYNNPYIFPVFGFLFMLTIIASRVCEIFEIRTKRVFVFNVFLSILATIFGLIFIVSIGELTLSTAVYPVIMVVITAMSIFELLSFAFSRIKFRLLFKIIRKTFAAEILYGLILLIIAFSFVFYMTEDTIETYGDGLWLSFAIVTTIGFGDKTVTSTLSRILAVFLGIYGIIVVAVITSIIVNFYNEVSKDDDKEIIEKETQIFKENKEKQRKELEELHSKQENNKEVKEKENSEE